MKRTFVALCLALGCSDGTGGGSAGAGGTAGTERDFEVECIGMTFGGPLARYYIVTTRFADRCQSLISDTVFENQLEIIDPELTNFAEPNTATLQIKFGGKTWVSREGSIEITRTEGNPDDGVLTEGRFDVMADTSDGDTARLHGPMDWCDYTRRTDCPYASTSDLTKRVEWEDPDGWDGGANSYANACRILFNESLGAVRVDMQVGVYDGLNTGLFAQQCGRAAPPPPNLFWFQATDVPGPGTYGPIQSVEGSIGGEEILLPGFSMKMPRIFQEGSGSCASLYDDLYFVDPTVDSECQWTITENPGRFELSCTNALHHETRNSYQRVGDFSLGVDCDVRRVQ